MRILFVNDIHAADKPPSSRTNNYLDEITAKLYDCKEIAKDCDLTIFTGDIFHQPRANAVSHSLVSHLINVLKDWPTPIKAVAGNHDLSEAGFSGVSRQPINVLAESGIIELLHQQGQWLDNATYAMFYGWDGNDLAKYKAKRPDGCRFFILVCHDMLCPDGQWPFEYLPYSQIAEMTDYDAIFYGHVHWDSGHQIIRHTRFINAGSLSRVARNEDNINRIIRVSVGNFNGSEFEIQFYRIESAKPAEEVFIMPKEQSQENAQFADYVKQIASSQVEVIDLDDYIVNLPIEEKIKERIFAYIR